MQPRYWAYTAKYIARAVLPDTPSAQEIHDMLLQGFQRADRDYMTGCIDIVADDLDPNGLVEFLNSRFTACPEWVLVESRPISQEEYEAWKNEEERFSKEEAEYLRNECADPPEW